MTVRFIAALLGAAASVSLAACEKPASEAIENATPSPNASILPAPLSSIGQAPAETPRTSEAPRTARKASDSEGKAAAADAAAPAPQALRGDQAPDDDSLTQREVQGVTLEGEWRYADAPAPLKGPEANPPGIEAARKSTAARMTIDLASVGRMRVTFDSRALPLARGTEIRARSDLYGHLLVWPNSSQYRVLPPGAVRTLMGERRVDAVPLVRAQTATKGEGAQRAGLGTKKWDLATRTGKLALEQARIPAAGEGGTLFCRFLSEIISLDPAVAPCSGDDVPLRAHFVWPDGGSIAFEVTAIAERVEFSTAQLLVPPSGGEFVPAKAPPPSSGVFLTRDELAAFRVRPFDAVGLRPIGTPEEGIVLYNGTDSLRYAFVDNVPVAWVAPNREQPVPGLQKGRYLLQWRTFLGDAVEAPITIEVPARVAVGVAVADAGARDR
jgi:hypothetical protein